MVGSPIMEFAEVKKTLRESEQGRMDENLPLTAFPCPGTDAGYAVHSKEKGLISCHLSEGEAIKAFAKHAVDQPDTDALIYSREVDGWSVL